MNNKIYKVLKDISYSVSQAQKEVELLAIKQYANFFEENKVSKQLKPKTISIPLPNNNREYEEHDIPVVALLHHSSLVLDSVTVKASVRMESKDDSKANNHSLKDDKDIKSTDIELNFKRKDAPEGLAKTASEYASKII